MNLFARWIKFSVIDNKVFRLIGGITSPLEGTKYIFLSGRSGEIMWTFDDDVSNVRFRSWVFTNTTGYTVTLAEIYRNDSATIESTLFDSDVVKPATLVLKNVDQRYNGMYAFSLTVVGRKAVTRGVTVFIAGTSFQYIALHLQLICIALSVCLKVRKDSKHGKIGFLRLIYHPLPKFS